MNKLKEIITEDGTLSLRDLKIKENFHNSTGALKETKHKFINPSKLERFKDHSVNVLDICFGLGYNSALLFNRLLKQSSKTIWYGLEIDKRPLEYSINNKSFKELWNPKIIDIYNSFLLNDSFKDNFFECKLMWGDARKEISKLPSNISFDLIFLDGFSPQKCPEIWTIEFLSKLSNKLKKDGNIVTYSSAAAVRKTFIDLGLKIYTIKPIDNSKNIWSNGTIAKKNINDKDISNNSFIKKLSIMEIEHLRTKASIPYRDPSGKASSEEIINKRDKEQLSSDLLNTNYWRSKWKMPKSSINS